MLPFQNRLKNNQEVEKVFTQGKSICVSSVMIKFVPSLRKATRVAFAVGTKFSSKAVLRNKKKRQLREAMKFFLPNLKSRFDIVVVLRAKRETDVPFDEIKKSLEKALKKAQLLVN